MNCGQCGKELPEGAKFCLNCGAAVQAPEPNAPDRESHSDVPAAEEDHVAPLGSAAAVEAAPSASEITGPSYASLADRLLAQVIDGVVGFGLFFFFGRAIGSRSGDLSSGGFDLNGTPALILFALLGVLMVGYFTVSEAVFGTTLGKLVAGIRVQRVTGEKLTMNRSFVRNILRLVDGLVLYLIGAVLVLVTKQNQRLGDMLAGTIVVRSQPRQPARGGALAAAIAIAIVGVVGGLALFSGSAQAGKFDQAGTTSAWNSNAKPDPKTFSNTFKTSDNTIYAVFKLTSSKGEVTATWKYQGQVMDVPGTTKLQVQGDRWAALSLMQSPASKPGEYEVDLVVTGSNEAKALKFTVVGGSASSAASTTVPGVSTATPQSGSGAQSSPTVTASKAKFDQVALIKDWNTTADPDPKNFATTFKSSDKEIDAVFKLAPGSDGKVAAIWKYKGRVLFEGGLLDVLNADYRIDAKAGKWTALYLSAATFPAGDYEVDLSIAGTTESKSLKFTITNSSTPVPSAKTKLDQGGLVNTLASGTDPDPKNFATVFKPSDAKIYVVFKLSRDTGVGPQWITATWKYRGDLLGTASKVSSDASWGSLFLAEPSFPAGDYQVDLTIPGTGETKQIKFTVK